MSTETDFAGRLRRAMQSKSLTVEALAAETGIAVRTIYRWRAGSTAPGVEALPLLCDALDVSADELLGL